MPPFTNKLMARMNSESTKMLSKSATCCRAEIFVVTTIVCAPVKNTTAEMVTIALTK